MTDKPAQPDPAAVQVEQAGTVNVGGPGELPHARVVMAVTFLVLAAFAVVTVYVLAGPASLGIDAATKGALIQTWNNLAIAAAMFWVGSSSGGKAAPPSPRT